MNSVTLMGRLTKDPELRFAAGSGTAVARFNLAVRRPFKKDETDFINCVSFGKTAETITQYCQKGTMICLMGRIQTGSYEAQDGTKRYTTDVVVERFEFCGGKSGNQSNGQNNNHSENPSNDPYGHFDDDDMTPVDDGDMPF